MLFKSPVAFHLSLFSLQNLSESRLACGLQSSAAAHLGGARASIVNPGGRARGNCQMKHSNSSPEAVSRCYSNQKFAHEDDFISFNNLCCGVMARAGGSDAIGGRFDPPDVKPKPTIWIFTVKPKPPMTSQKIDNCLCYNVAYATTLHPGEAYWTTGSH